MSPREGVQILQQVQKNRNDLLGLGSEGTDGQMLTVVVILLHPYVDRNVVVIWSVAFRFWRKVEY